MKEVKHYYELKVFYHTDDDEYIARYMEAGITAHGETFDKAVLKAENMLKTWVALKNKGK
jgi:predicted RNase H-like HicB family nuclease